MIKHIKFLLILFFLICVKNHSQKNMNIDFITGIEHNDLVGDSLKLESKTFFAFKKMEDAAKKDGIILKIVSAIDLLKDKILFGIKNTTNLPMNIH